MVDGDRGRGSRVLIRTSVYDEFSGSMKLLHAWNISIIVIQHLVQIGRVDGPIEYLSQIPAAIRPVGTAAASKRRRHDFKKASGSNWSSRWTYRVFIINTHRD